MPTVELKLRRDVEGDIDAMTPAEGEPIYDITNKRLRVGDGSTSGGLHLSAAADLQRQTFTYALVTGTDTLTASLTPAIAGEGSPLNYPTAFKALIQIANNNTGAVTINFDSVGAKTIKKHGGADDLAADDLVAGGFYEIAYDGTNMQLLPLPLAVASSGLPVADTTSIVEDPVDTTKEMRIDVEAVATGTVRVITMPDQNVDLTPDVTFQAFDAVLEDLAALSPVADNEIIVGTGAGTYAHESGTTARTSLGLAIGTDVQAQDAVLEDIAALSPVADNEIIVGTGAGTYAHESGGTARTSLGLAIGSDVQAFDAVLEDIAALSPVADNEIIVGTGAGTYAHESGGTARTSLGLAIGTDVQAEDAVLTDLSALSAVADNEFIVGTGAGVYAHENPATARGSMGAQAQDAVLDDLAALAPVADNQFIVGSGAGTYAYESPTTVRTTLGLVIGTDVQAEDAVLTDLAALGVVADNEFIVGTGAGTYAHENPATARGSMGAQAQDAVLDDLAALTAVADNEFIVGTGAGVYAHENPATARTSMDAQQDVVTTRGDVVRGDGSGNAERLELGAAGEVLTSVGGDAAWAAAAAGLPVADTTSIVEDPVDATKEMRIDVEAVATATVRVLTMPDQNVDLTPDTTFQAFDAVLQDLAALPVVADNEIIVGTGAGTYAHESGATARTSLGLSIGSDVQAFDTHLEDLAALTPAAGADEVMVSTGVGAWARESGTTLRTSLGLAIGTNVQAFDVVLDDLAALSAVADNEFVVGTGAGTYAHESGATVRTSLGLTIGTDVQTQDAVLDDLAALSPVADNEIIVGTGAGTYAHESGATARTSLGLAIGTDVQAQAVVLDDLAALSAVADNEIIVGTGAGVYAHESGATARTSLGLTIGTDVQADVVTTRGDVVLGDASGNAERLELGASGFVLTSDGTDAAWAASGVTPGTSAASRITLWRLGQF